MTFKDGGGPTHSIGPCRTDECSSGTDFRYVNKPQAADPSLINPANPKDVVTAALPSLGAVMDNMLATWLEMTLGGYNGSLQDVPDTFSLPVFMIQQAVNSMATVKNLGEQQAKEDKIRLILEILGIVFAFLPFVDEFTPALGVLDGVFETVSLVGNVALDIQKCYHGPPIRAHALARHHWRKERQRAKD